MQPKLKVFFDVDGVLIDGWHANSALSKRWDLTLEADLGVDREAFQHLLFGVSGEQSVSLMHQCISGLRDLRDVLEEVLPRIGFNGRADDFIRYWFGKDSRLNAEVIRLVEDLRTSGAADLYIATGQEHHRAKYLWNNLGLSKCFDGMFYSADIGLPKTNVRFFEAINRRLGIAAAERPIFFDDQAMIVDLARAVGWDATPYTSARDVVEHPRLLALWSFSQTDSR